MKQDQETINAQAELEIRNRLLELREVTIRREELVRELNGFADMIQYKHSDYDSATHYDQLGTEVAEAGDLSYQGMRAVTRRAWDTFWIASADRC